MVLRERAGYHVIECATPEEALKICESVKFHLMICDVTLGSTTGTELAKCLEQQQPGAALLFTSGAPREYLVELGFLPENAHFLMKPYTAQSLLDMVRAVLGSAGAVGGD
jgi:DNA-binding NarL/FixJ family response regulator